MYFTTLLSLGALSTTILYTSSLTKGADLPFLSLFSYNLVNEPLKLKKDDNSYVKIDKEKLSQIDIPFIIENYESSDQLGKHDGDKLRKKILNLYKSFKSES